MVDGDGRTTVAGLFAAGDVADMATDPDAADAQARQVGRATAAFARGGAAIGSGTGSPGTRTGDPPRSVSVGHAVARTTDTAAGMTTDAVLCFCEDVRGREIQAERAAGYADPELVKRRTGALTGPCQGKYCLSAVTCALNGADPGQPPANVVLPTGRPPLRPVRLGDLAAGEAPSPASRDRP